MFLPAIKKDPLEHLLQASIFMIFIFCVLLNDSGLKGEISMDTPVIFRSKTFQAMKPGTVQVVAAGATSAASASATEENTRIVRVVCTQACHIVFGVSPTATTNDTYLPASYVEYFSVPSSLKIAAIRAGGSDGILYMTEMR